MGIKYFLQANRRFIAAVIVVLTIAVTGVVATTTMSPADAAEGCTSTILKKGLRGTCVSYLQKKLNAAGYNVGAVDGSFGPNTRAGVIRYQRHYGLAVDGVVGKNTWKQLAGSTKTTSTSTDHLSSIKNRSGVNIVADKSDKKVYVFKDGVLQRTIRARFGGEVNDNGKKSTRNTPTGSYVVQAKIKNGYSYKYDASMPYFTVFNGDIGFHYSRDFATTGYGANGKRGSHGCVNIASLSDAKYIYNLARTGSTRVVVQK